MGVVIGIGVLFNKNSFEGAGLLQKGQLIGRGVLNQIIMVVLITIIILLGLL